PGRQRKDKRTACWASVVLRVHAAGTSGPDCAQGLLADLCRAQRSAGSTCAVSVGNAGANSDAAPESADTAPQWVYLLRVATSNNATLCMEGRRVPRLGIGSIRGCGSCHRQPCHAAVQQVLLAIKGVAERIRGDNCRSASAWFGAASSVQFGSCKPVRSVAPG